MVRLNGMGTSRGYSIVLPFRLRDSEAIRRDDDVPREFFPIESASRTSAVFLNSNETRKYQLNWQRGGRIDVNHGTNAVGVVEQKWHERMSQLQTENEPPLRPFFC